MMGAQPGWARLARRIAVLAAVSTAAFPAIAADPQTYRVTIARSGNSALDDALSASSQLETLRSKGPVSPFALTARARLDAERLQTVLQSFGFYDGRVTVTVNGMALSDPSLGDAIAAIPQGEDAQVAVALELGPLYRIGVVSVEGDIPPDARAKLGLNPGAPAVASDVLAARGRLLNALQEDGYALAKVDAPIAILDPRAHLLDVTFNVNAGPRVDIGEITFTGLATVNESLLRRRLLVHTGELYSASKIEKARQDLLSLGVFSAVTARIGDQVDDKGRIPLVFEARERPRHVVGATGNYSTDLGGSVGLNWSNRNLFGNAEQLNLSANVLDIGGRVTGGVGYNMTAQFLKPDFLRRDQSLQFTLGALKQSLPAYDQDAVSAGALLNRKLTDTWNAGIGLSGVRESIVQQGITRDYTLLGLPLNVRFDNTGLTNPLADPTRGVRGGLTVTPTLSIGMPNIVFVVVQTNASVYFDLARLGWTDPGRSVFAARGLVGVALGASQFDLPADQRFYAGGSTTVRGYAYQSIGPQFPDGTPQGGTAVDAASLEFRQRIASNFGMALFVDAGHVSPNGVPFQGTPHYGAGIGVRYYTPIGAVRLDAAMPLNKIPGGAPFELYIGLGQSF